MPLKFSLKALYPNLKYPTGRSPISIMTSGTTGTPKGVMLTHNNISTHALATIAELKLTDRDVWIHAAPLFHLADAWATFAITWVGGRHVMVTGFRACKNIDYYGQ